MFARLSWMAMHSPAAPAPRMATLKAAGVLSPLFCARRSASLGWSTVCFLLRWRIERAAGAAPDSEDLYHDYGAHAVARARVVDDRRELRRLRQAPPRRAGQKAGFASVSAPPRGR